MSNELLVDHLEHKLEEACEEIIYLRGEVATLAREYDGAKAACESLAIYIRAQGRANDDLDLQIKFWRQACEHAVTGWNKLEDKYESIIESARNAETCLANTLAYLEPVVEDQPAEECTSADLGFGPLRVVEEETPL